MIIVGKQNSHIESEKLLGMIRSFEEERKLNKSFLIVVSQNGFKNSKAEEKENNYDYLLREPVCFRDLFKIVKDNIGLFQGLDS